MAAKIDLCSRFESAWQDWNEALAGLDDDEIESSSIYRQWTLKDIMGHVYSYMSLYARHLASYQKRKRLASPRAPSYGYFNRREAARLKKAPVRQLRAGLNAAYRDFMARLATLTEEDFKRVFPSQWSNSKYRVTLRSLLREEAGHMAGHAADVRKWREREHVGR